MKVAVDEGEGRHLRDRPGLALARVDDARRVPEPPLDRNGDVLLEREAKHAQLTEVPEQDDKDGRERGDRDGSTTSRGGNESQRRRERSCAQQTCKRRDRQVVG